MNAKERNRQVFTETGIIVTGLPEQYKNDHPTSIVIKLGKIHDVWELLPTSTVTYDLEFKSPPLIDGKRKVGHRESTGYLVVDLKSHSQNRKLLELLDYMDDDGVTLKLHGRQYESIFYVTAFYPSADCRLSQKAFFYFLNRLGFRYEFPFQVFAEGSAEEAEKHYLLLYKLFRDEYPKSIQQYLDSHLDEREYRDSVKGFILADWRKPELDLPSVVEAHRILDSTVYGMESVKERLLEVLEGIRRNGSLANNLLLVGPPGTGKTTVMQAIAKMLRLPMSVVPMSACADLEAFVGFARTYAGAQEGLVTSKLLSPVLERPDGRRETVHQIAQVLFLNELDKSDPDKNHHGSVQSAVLRMTDDNRSFFDVYHEAELDLSNVLIVADCNDTRKIMKPLLDRFEVVEIPPYSAVEKAIIFRRYVFPAILQEKGVSSSEVSVTSDAVSLIVASSHSEGVRELKKIAHRIVGNYLLHHAQRRSIVRYTTDMVRPFLPKQDVRYTTFVHQPGSIRSVVLTNTAKNVQVQCLVSRSKTFSFHLYGSSDQLLQQELEAATICACRLLPGADYDVKVQLYGIDGVHPSPGQLGFPVFIAVLSAAYKQAVDGVFFGGVTILGGLTSTACDNPDAIRALAEESGEANFYTAKGFSERLTQGHGEVLEFLDAETAAAYLFGDSVVGLRRIV